MKTIVVVDDEFGLPDVLATTLSDIGFRVLTAANGLRGVEVISEQLPDLVILNFMMPLLDGPGVLRAMRADPRLARLPVLMMSGLPESAVSARCTGYVAFLRKPFALDVLLDTVRRAVGADSG